MASKRIPPFASVEAREPVTLSGWISRRLRRVGRSVMAPPAPPSVTFDARQSHLMAWLRTKDRELYEWFEATRRRIVRDLGFTPRPKTTKLIQRERPRRGLATRFTHDERGVAAIMSALFMSVMLTVSAMAIDVGYKYLQERKLQGMADLAAIAAAADLDNAQQAAFKAVNVERWSDPLQVTVTTGHYSADVTLPPERRFTAGGTPRNAARVKLTSSSPLFFGSAILHKDSVDIARSAVATTAELASFSIGTRLASLDGGIANALLSGLTGSTVSLSVMDYNALLGANVELFKYIEVLRTELGLQAATFEDVLKVKLRAPRLIESLADFVESTGGSKAASALRHIANAAISTADIALGDLVDLGPYAVQDRVSLNGSLGLKVNALDMVNGALTLASKDRQVKLNLGLTVPGLASVDVWLGIGERPNNSSWLTITNDGERIIRTAQTRLYINAKLLPNGLLSSNGVALVNLPVLIELASAEAKLDDIECSPKASDRLVRLLVRPSVGHVSIAEIDPSKINDFKTPLAEKPATLVSAILLKVTAQARVDIGGSTWQKLAFTQADIDNGTVKSVKTSDIAQTTVSSLLTNLKLNVNVLGIGIGLGNGPVTSTLNTLLGAVAKPLDGVLNQLTGLLGVQLGEADVRANGLRCHAGALVL